MIVVEGSNLVGRMDDPEEDCDSLEKEDVHFWEAVIPLDTRKKIKNVVMELTQEGDPTGTEFDMEEDEVEIDNGLLFQQALFCATKMARQDLMYPKK